MGKQKGSPRCTDSLEPGGNGEPCPGVRRQEAGHTKPSALRLAVVNEERMCRHPWGGGGGGGGWL